MPTTLSQTPDAPAAQPRRLKIYAGIGSRETPKEMLDLFEQVAYALGMRGFICRSGGADGADAAFEAGARRAMAEGFGQLELFLPWQGFNDRQSIYCNPPAEATEIASKLHPGWARLSQGPRKLMARNAQQIMGPSLSLPSTFVLCWTPDGCVDGATRTRATGGTGQAIAHASGLGIPVYNAQRPDHLGRIVSFLEARAIGKPVSEGQQATGDGAQRASALRI